LVDNIFWENGFVFNIGYFVELLLKDRWGFLTPSSSCSGCKLCCEKKFGIELPSFPRFSSSCYYCLGIFVVKYFIRWPMRPLQVKLVVYNGFYTVKKWLGFELAYVDHRQGSGCFFFTAHPKLFVVILK